MAVIKATNSKTGGNLKKIIAYVTKEEKTEDKYISGQNCNPETALEEMQATKERFSKVDGREYKHFVQSFKPGEVTAEKAHQIALEWSEKHFKGHEVLIATHEDKKHTHTHFIVNSVNFENGKKLQQSKEDLKEMKLSSDRICEREGLSVITEKSKEITTFSQDKYKAIEKAIEGDYKSYVVNTALAVNKALNVSTSREEFIKNMDSQGYSVKWTDTNKNVTFTNSEGEKVRLSNLQKTFKDERYSKEGLENEFARLREQRVEESNRAKGDNSRGDKFGLSWNKSEIGTSTSRTNITNKQSNEGVRKSGEGERGAVEETSREGRREPGNQRENQHNIQSHATRNEGAKGNELSEVGGNSSKGNNRIRQTSRHVQGNDKDVTGLSEPNKEHTKTIMEGESKAIFTPTSINSRSNSSSSRGISTSSLDDILKALESSVEKVQQEEKAKAEREAERLEQKASAKKKTKEHEDELER